MNEQQVRNLYEGSFMAEARNVVLVGGPGTGKTHLAIAIAGHAIKQRKRSASQGLSEAAMDELVAQTDAVITGSGD